MAGTVFVPPGGAGAKYHAPTEEMLRIREKCVEIWNTIQELKKHSAAKEHQAAFDFFGRLRALSGIVGLLAEQPGYRPNDPAGQALRDRMKPLKAKMDDIMRDLNATVNLTDPLPYTAPSRVAWTISKAEALARILLDPNVAKDLDTIRYDKTLPLSTKEVFFDWVGHHVNDAMLEVVKSKKHEEQIFEAVMKTLDSHEKNTMIGACLWASQAAASSAGNLPGPNSLYVGAIRLRAIRGFKELATRAPNAILGDILPHWFEALKLSPQERTDFELALNEFNAQHKIAASTPQNPSRTEELARELAQARAKQIYDEKLHSILKKSGSPQSGAMLSAGMSILNIVCLYFVWQSMPDANWNFRNVADMASATVLAGTGICATLVRMKVNIQWMTKLVEHPYVGIGIGVFAGFVTALDGFDVIWEASTKTKKDWWMISSGVLQIGSGFAMVLGACFAAPGVQLVGVLLGLAAGAIAIVVDLAKEPMDEFIKELLEKIKSAKCEWNGSPIMDNVGLKDSLEVFEKLVGIHRCRAPRV
ncbi:MAG: hypothetical protein QM820_28925 [Minicystis sp.]